MKTPTLRIAGTLTAADTDKREISYLLLPYGEEGRTSAGRVTASAGSVTVPEDVSSVTFNIEHDGTRPVGRATRVEETPDGLLATFRIARTRLGDDLLEEVSEGLRAAASVEVEDPIIRAGKLIGGLLTAAAAVVRPAFPSAQVQLVAADAGELPEDEAPTDSADAATDASSGPAASADPNTAEADPAEESTEEQKEEDMESTNAAAPADLMVASRSGASKNALDTSTPYGVAKLVASIHNNPGDSTLLAALTDVTQTNVYDASATPQYVGELWNERSYQQKYASLINGAPLTSMKVIGWRFVTTPVVGDYAGNKAAIPSNGVTTEAVEATAARLAGGWDVDRIMVDFPNPEFWSAFFKAATDDYARKVDAKVLTHLTSVSVAATGGAVPSGVAAGAVKLVDGALELLDDDVVPSFAIMGSDLYREFLLTRKDETLEYLNAALGLEDGQLAGFRIVPTADAALTGKVLVGAKAASTLYQLPGTPIRVSALDIARGGVDEALSGYYALIHSGRGLVTVS